MTNRDPSYYAVIPADVRYCEYLPANAKLLYGEISALASKEGYCWASNKYFADLYGVSDRVIRTWVSKLVEFGFVESVIENTTERKIYVKVGINLPGGRNKSSWGVGTKVPHSITSNNTAPSNEGVGSTPTLKKTKTQNEEVSFLIGALKDALKSSNLDGTVPKNRQFAWLMIKKFGFQDSKEIIKKAARDSYHKTRMTSMAYIYKNGVGILKLKSGVPKTLN